MTDSNTDSRPASPVLKAVEADPDAAARAAAARQRRVPAKPPAPAVKPVRLPNPPPRTVAARPRRRHYAMLASFTILVLLPFVASVVYLYGWAADEYHSQTSFSIRSEEMGSAAAGLLGAITQIGSGSASDSDILYDYIRSQEIVSRIDAKLDLRAIYNRAPEDPVFTLGDNPSIEALLNHWRRMVTVNLETREGIIDVRTFAFDPEDARRIAQEILDESNALVNQLSNQARDDAVRFARDELTKAESHLRKVRQNLANFRLEHRMIDPSGDVAGQAGLLNALQGELAKALVERDVLLSYADEKDQRVIQVGRRIDALNDRIEAERNSLEAGGAANSLPSVVGDYEKLKVDLEIANTAYTHGLAGLAAADAEARRQSRYLVPHIQPTLAQTALYPRRALITLLVGLFLVLGWSVMMLVYYNVRDNR